MSVELIGIVAVGATLTGVILTSNRGLRKDVRDDMKQLGNRVGRMEHSQAKLEGLLEGLREAISGRAAAS